MKRIFSLFPLLVGFAILATGADATAEDFYKGKTIRFIVGQAPGGGYDTYIRTIARHIGKHIPGNPGAAVENMEGAGSLIAANYVYRQASRDGLTVVNFNNSLVLQKGLGDPRIKIDFRKLGWVGAPSVGVPVCMVMGFTGLKTLDDVLKTKKPLKVGATRAGSAGYDLPLIMNKTLGTNFEVISGFTGTATTRVALQKREVNSFCSQWESMRVTARAMLDAPGDDKLIPFIIAERWEDPEVKDLPLFKDAIKDPKKYAIYRAWSAQMDFQRPLAVAPGTPKDRLAILRKGLEQTLKDPELLAEAKKSKLVITPVSGEKTDKLVDEILSMSADVKKSLSFLVRKAKS
ncbi:MAG: Bug family tripartite tricarboxylate transporter substrate binding protein [Chloroflexota bacterium]